MSRDQVPDSKTRHGARLLPDTRKGPARLCGCIGSVRAGCDHRVAARDSLESEGEVSRAAVRFAHDDRIGSGVPMLSYVAEQNRYAPFDR